MTRVHVCFFLCKANAYGTVYMHLTLFQYSRKWRCHGYLKKPALIKALSTNIFFNEQCTEKCTFHPCSRATKIKVARIQERNLFFYMHLPAIGIGHWYKTMKWTSGCVQNCRCCCCRRWFLNIQNINVSAFAQQAVGWVFESQPRQT